MAYGITINVCRDIGKKRQRHIDQFTSLTDLGAFVLPSGQPDAEEVVLHTQERDLIAIAWPRCLQKSAHRLCCATSKDSRPMKCREL